MKVVVLGSIGLLTACAAGLSDGAAERRDRIRTAIALADPAFGGGAILEQRLFGSPLDVPSGDPAERQRYVQQVRERADAEALALVRELAPDTLVDSVADFVGTPAAASSWAAEALALAMFRWPADDFVDRAASVFADPDQCGEAALERMRELQRDMVAGASPSPGWVAILGAAVRVRAEHARSIAVFLATDPGAAWQTVRATALARTQPRFVAVQQEAGARGFVTPALDNVGPLDTRLPEYLPRPAEMPALTFDVDAAGAVRCGDDELPNVARAEELTAALCERRARLLAQGVLHLERVPGADVEAVAEIVLIRAAKGTPWAPVGALMKLFSQPSIAFWQIELDCDPAVVPPQLGPQPEVR